MTATPQTRAAWLPAIALAVLFTAFQIQSSLYNGALALPATYDDVGYFNDALARLDSLYRDGGWAFLKGFWTSPPHAPLQTLLAMLGFATLAREPWAADAMNALPLVFMLRLFFGYARAVPPAVSVVLAAALLGFPLLGALVLEFRPDMLCALLTAIGAFMITLDPSWRAQNSRTMAVVTALFVAALLAKPTLAPVTLTIFAAAVAAALVLQPRSQARSTLRAAMFSCGIGILLVAPYYLAVAGQLYAYIFDNAFGAQASIWAVKLPWHHHVLYYLTGPGGNLSIGRPWLALGALLAVPSIPLLWPNKRATLAALMVGTVAYAAVTLPSMKSPFIGMVVPALFGVGVAVLVLVIWRRFRPVVGLVIALALVLFSAVAWRPVMQRSANATIPAEQSVQYQHMYNELVDTIAAVPELSRQQVYFPVIGSHLNPENLEFGLRQRRVQLPKMPLLYTTDDETKLRYVSDRSEILVLFSDDSTLPLSWTPTAKHRARINAEVEASKGYTVIRTIDGGPYKGSLRVLLRIR